MAEWNQPLEGGTVEDEEQAPPPFRALTHRRALVVVAVLIVLVLLALLPPLLNVNRYKRQIATSISASLGRPVHLESVTLNLLPMPGFTLEQFVVGEDPIFGAEPVIRANEVRATLRVSSLWRRRVEFSKIELDDPSVNLVHLPDGRWNLQSILLQASRMAVAPTAQKKAGTAQRFPYIEATGARVNLKMGLEKMPISLTDADFALWLPKPDEWHLRLKAHPARTDAASMDSGLLRVEGTLGRAATLAEVPVNLEGEWSAAPLGALSWLIVGRDAGLRGEANVTANVHGSMGLNAVNTGLELTHVRRADFVPAHPLGAEVRCSAQMAEVFHALHQLRCGEASDASPWLITGDVPELLHPAGANGQLDLKDFPAAGLLELLHVASNRVSPTLTASGAANGQITCCAAPGGQLSVRQATLGLAGETPFLAQDVSANLADAQWTLPVALNLGGKDPAVLLVHADRSGYTLRLTGLVLHKRLEELATALPQFGDGLDDLLDAAPEGDQPIHLDAIAHRTWGGEQTWIQAAEPAHGPALHRRVKH